MPTTDLARRTRHDVTAAYRDARKQARAELTVLSEVIGVDKAAELATLHLMHAVARMLVLDDKPADPAAQNLLDVIASDPADEWTVWQLLASAWNVPAEVVGDAATSYDPDELVATDVAYRWQSDRFDAYVAGERPTLATYLPGGAS